MKLAVSLELPERPWISTAVENQQTLMPTSLSCLWTFYVCFSFLLLYLKFTEFTVQSVCGVFYL